MSKKPERTFLTRCAEAGLCPASAQRVDKPHPRHSEPVTDVTGVGIRIFSNRNLRKAQNLCVLETDCRVAALLAMTARRCRADGTSGRRPLRVVQRAYPVGRDPCIPPFCSCHSEFVGADDSARPPARTGVGIRLSKKENGLPRQSVPQGHLLRGAHWLAMTDFFGSLRGGALPRLCCFAGTSSRKCNSCRNTLHETV